MTGLDPDIGATASMEPDRSGLPDDAALRSAHRRLWRKGWGGVSAADLITIRDLVAERRPGTVVEVGVASGLSAGFVGQFLGAIGGGRLVGVDLATRFYADQSRPVGFLAPPLMPATVSWTLVSPGTAFDLSAVVEAETVDLAFIDGDHEHPWPTLDLIAVLPLMKPGGVVVFDDVHRGRERGDGGGLGPDLLFKALRPHGARLAGRLFVLDLDRPIKTLEPALARALAHTWHPRRRLSDAFAAQIEHRVREAYGGALDGLLSGRRRPYRQTPRR